MAEHSLVKKGFPKCVLLPKSDTGADRFLLKYPKWDGRGITIAVLDTGVDPEANGLKETSVGEPKILNLIDTTGSGDVDTSTIRTTSMKINREIESLTGRLLKIPDEWCNPTGRWHVGMKAEYDILPDQVKNRAKEHFFLKVWEPNYSSYLAQAIRELKLFDLQYLKLSKPPLSLLLEKENLEAKVDILRNLSSKVVLPGSMFDCIVFHDGESWSSVIDSSVGLDLGCQSVLKEFKESGKSLKLGNMSLSVNVYNDGNVLSIVTSGGSHGTHVASIAASHVPDNQDLNGIAPGAQIVSIKIGDSRLGTMETASSLIRACIAAVANDVDIINFSYGEASHWTNKGAVLEMMSELCSKHNIVFVSSAGNNGPALSTVGCPGGNTSGLIGVGAFVSPDMMAADYSMTHTKPGLPYTWSSRGPASDGDLGVCITAPGGAVTSVPIWTLQKNQLMNGTSMSSPNACGCIALLLSALKSNGIPYTPALIKKIIENTAAPLGSHDQFSVGHGVLQIDKAYAAAMAKLPSGLVDLEVSVLSGQKRGIYLREPHQIGKLIRASVSVKPKFRETADEQEKIEFELHLALVSTESWVVSPKHLALWNGVRQFIVEVDPRKLPSGVHYAEVRAYVPEDDRGPLFRVPVTVIIPNELTDKKKCVFLKSSLEFSKNKVHRFFFDVPLKAAWAELELSDAQCEFRTRITVHTVQLLPEKSFRERENYEVVSTEPEGVATVVLCVEGGYTMELCLTQYWSELKDATVNLKLVFHAVQPSTATLTFNGANMWTSIQVTSAICEEEVSPEFKLTHHIVSKRPTSHKINPLGSRDVLPGGAQIYELVLTYNFHLSRTTEIRPEVSLMSDLLYENPYGGQLWMVFNSKKQFFFAGDAYSKHYSSKLDKGDYILKLQVRHSKQTELKKLSEMPILLHLKLSASITLEVTESRYGVFSGPKFTGKVLKPGISSTVYLRALPDEKLSKLAVQQGDILSGRFTFSKQEKIKKKIGYALQYIVGPKVNKSASIPASGEKKEDTQEEYEEALKDFKMKWMKCGVLSTEQLEEDYAEDVDFLMGKLKKIAEDEDCSYDSAKTVVLKVFSKIDINEVLAYMGVKVDMSADSNKAKSIEKKKKCLVECLLLEGSILIKKHLLSDRLPQIYVDLHKLLDKKDAQLRVFSVKYAEARGHFSTAVKLIEEEISEKGVSRALDEQLIKYYRELGWDHYADLQEKWLVRKYPQQFQLF